MNSDNPGTADSATTTTTKMAAATTDYKQSAVSSVGSLHKAIRDGDFDCLKECNQELLVQPNSIGWTALHFCAAAAAEISLEQWKWILESVEGNDTALLDLRTDGGHNCVNHFFRRYLQPLEWQRHEVKEEARLLQESLQAVLNNEDLLQQLQDALFADEETPEGPQSLMNIEHLARIVPFWRRSQIMLARVSSQSLLHALATAGCPESVALLAIKLHPDQVAQRDSSGNLPLHLACRNKGCDVIMRCLLHPKRAAELDAQNRLPLHLALVCGKTWYEDGVNQLWKSNPLLGGTLDPATGLPAFCLAALPDEGVCQHKTRTLAATNNFGLFRFLPNDSQKLALQQARHQVNLTHLTTILELLRAAPNAIACCSVGNLQC